MKTKELILYLVDLLVQDGNQEIASLIIKYHRTKRFYPESKIEIKYKQEKVKE